MVDGVDQWGTPVSRFQPVLVTIQRTGIVVWNNSTGLGHSVTFAPLNGAPTEIPSSATGVNMRTFNAPGDFCFFCTAHVAESGIVRVQ